MALKINPKNVFYMHIHDDLVCIVYRSEDGTVLKRMADNPESLKHITDFMTQDPLPENVFVDPVDKTWFVVFSTIDRVLYTEGENTVFIYFKDYEPPLTYDASPEVASRVYSELKEWRKNLE